MIRFFIFLCLLGIGLIISAENANAKGFKSIRYPNKSHAAKSLPRDAKGRFVKKEKEPTPSKRGSPEDKVERGQNPTTFATGVVSGVAGALIGNAVYDAMSSDELEEKTVDADLLGE